MSAMWIIIIIIIIAVPRTGSIQFFAGRPKCEEGGVEARAPVSEAGPKSSGKRGQRRRIDFSLSSSSGVGAGCHARSEEGAGRG